MTDNAKSARMRALWANPEYREKQRASRSRAAKRRWQEPKYRQLMESVLAEYRKQFQGQFGKPGAASRAGKKGNLTQHKSQRLWRFMSQQQREDYTRMTRTLGYRMNEALSMIGPILYYEDDPVAEESK